MREEVYAKRKQQLVSFFEGPGKVIANSIKKVLPSTIHHNQAGFIKGRFIGEVARSILDIVHTEALKPPGVLLFIDFEKAFDSIRM